MKREISSFVAAVGLLLPLSFTAKHHDSPANISTDGFTQVELSAGVDTAWVRHYASGTTPSTDRAVDLALDKFGNVYVTGYSTSPSKGYDFHTIKYRSDGTEAWSARYDGHRGDDMPAAIRVDDAGNVYVAGISGRDYATIKYDAFGLEQWVAHYHGGNDYQQATDLEVDKFGNVYVTGSLATIKYDAFGKSKWVAPTDWGFASNLALDDSGNVYVTGNTRSLENEKNDYVTIKYNASGAVQWQVHYDGPAKAKDEANALAVDHEGNVYVLGSSTGSGTSSDFATIKYDASGVEQWVVRYNGAANNRDEAYAIAVDGAGEIYVMGYSTPQTYTIIKYDANGIRKWIAHTAGSTARRLGVDFEPALAIDKRHNVYLTGRFETNGVTVKFDGSGVEQWRAQITNPEDLYGYVSAVAVDDTGNVYVAGAYGIHDYAIMGDHYGDYVTVKYGASGAEQWAAHFDGPGSSSDSPCDVAVDQHDNLYVTGASEYLWERSSVADYVTVKYDATGAQQWLAVYDGQGATLDRPVANAVDSASNLYVTGTSADDFLTIKYDPSGAAQWLARYNGLNNARDEAVDLDIDGNGNVYVTGWSESAVTEVDMTTIKYDASGVELWVARYHSRSERPSDMAVDAAGNVYVLGLGYDGVYDYAVTTKYDASGQFRWITRFAGSSNAGYSPSALAIDDSGKVYVTGSSRSAGGGSQYATTIKYDAVGMRQWVADHSGGGSSADIALDKAGNVYITGERINAKSDYVTIKYNAAGVEQWVAAYNGPTNDYDAARALVVDELGNVYVTGYSTASGASSDFLTLKYNSSGKEQWVARYNGTGNGWNEASALTLDGAGNLYVVGISTGWSWSKMTIIKYVETPTPVVSHEPEEQPGDFSLEQNYPNPFSQIPRFAGNPATTISFTLPKASFVTLKIYDLLGNEVATLVTEKLPAGKHQSVWEAKGLTSGVYVYRIEAGEFVQAKKLILLR